MGRDNCERFVDSWVPITTREIEVLRLMGEGRTVEAIAESMSISRYTVWNHIRNVRLKLELWEKINGLPGADHN